MNKISMKLTCTQNPDPLADPEFRLLVQEVGGRFYTFKFQGSRVELPFWIHDMLVSLGPVADKETEELEKQHPEIEPMGG